MTLTFLLYTVFCLFGTACFAKVMHFSIQPDQWLDSLFGWQDKLERFGNKTGAFNALLYKAGGACSFCFAHAISFICFGVYATVMCFSGSWPEFESIIGQWIFNIGWYTLYVSFGTTFGSLAINRL